MYVLAFDVSSFKITIRKHGGDTRIGIRGNE